MYTAESRLIEGSASDCPHYSKSAATHSPRSQCPLAGRILWRVADATHAGDEDHAEIELATVHGGLKIVALYLALPHGRASDAGRYRFRFCTQGAITSSAVKTIVTAAESRQYWQKCRITNACK